MAQKRMFSLQVVSTDRFVEMSTSAQALYFHLGMHGDDDGFVSSPRMIMRVTGCNDNDLQELISNDFVIQFGSGVLAITDWAVHNTIQKDRYHKTLYTNERATLTMDDTKRYSLVSNMDAECIQAVSMSETEIRLDKNRLDKSSKEEGRREVWRETTPQTMAEREIEFAASRDYFVETLRQRGR